MTKEQSTFIRILSDYLNNRKTEIIYDLNWNRIISYAHEQQVSGIIYTQIKDFLPATKKEEILRATIETYYIYEKIEKIISILKQILTENDIAYFIIKGPIIAGYYREPFHRIMGDIDIVVHKEDRDTVHDLFINKGFASISKEQDREWQYGYISMEIELHDRLVYQEVVNEAGQDVFFNDCWKYVKQGQLDWDFHLLFLIFHLRKHFMNSGIGFRYFMDLAVAIQTEKTDWNWLEKNLQITGMLPFAKKCFGFVDKWFGIRAPIADTIENDFYNAATNKVFADGLFGFDNTDNENTQTINQLRREKHFGLSMIHNSFKHIFLAYNTMKDMNQYHYLHSFPPLLPIAWIHRIISKRKKMRKKIQECFPSGEKIKDRDMMMKKWGL